MTRYLSRRACRHQKFSDGTCVGVRCQLGTQCWVSMDRHFHAAVPPCPNAYNSRPRYLSRLLRRWWDACRKRCDNCGGSQAFSIEHYPIPESPGVCWLSPCPGAAERSDEIQPGLLARAWNWFWGPISDERNSP